MKLFCLILLVFLFTDRLINAQTDFKPGYIIKNSGDTLYGEIDYRGDRLMGRVCKFKNTDISIIDYSPNDILEYRFINGKYYVSRELNGSKVFLEYLIHGKINIYYIRNKDGDLYYLDKEDVKLSKVPYKEGFKYVDDKKVYYESKHHFGILDYYMHDAPEFQPRIQQVKKPEHQSLISLVENYHNLVCKEEKCIIYEKRLPILKISFEAFGGVIKYNGYNKFLSESGGYLFIWAPRTNEKLFFKTGISYHQTSEEGMVFKKYRFPIQIQYIFRAYNIQPKISGGVNFWSAKLDDFKGIGHTICLNAGLNYEIFKSVSLSTSFNTDYTPISNLIVFDLKFDIVSYSINCGLFIDL